MISGFSFLKSLYNLHKDLRSRKGVIFLVMGMIRCSQPSFAKRSGHSFPSLLTIITSNPFSFIYFIWFDKRYFKESGAVVIRISLGILQKTFLIPDFQSKQCPEHLCPFLIPGVDLAIPELIDEGCGNEMMTI